MINEGKIDRLIRTVLGIVLLLIVFIEPQYWFGWLGLIPLATGVAGVCPLYRLIGVRTTRAPCSSPFAPRARRVRGDFFRSARLP